jgi:hypothetical protein
VIDGDSDISVTNVRNGLAGLGLSLPQVETVSGGRHWYLLVKDAPKDFNWARLNQNIGPGELRVRNAFVVAPCSQINGRRYQFVQGDPETVGKLRPVHWADLKFLLPQATSSATVSYDAPPIRLLWRPMPDKARELLADLVNALKGINICGYASRSEAEAAVVMMLILAGWTLQEIEQTFEAKLPAHYANKGKRGRQKYLYLTYRKALMRLASEPERAKIADLYSQAKIWPWPRRGGDLECAVYLGVLAIGWQCGSFEVGASLRCLAEYAAATPPGVSYTLQRLENGGYLRKVSPHTATQAAVWRIEPRPLQYFNTNHNTTNIHGNMNKGPNSSDERVIAEAEIWSAIGRSCRLVFEHLAHGQILSVQELTRRTRKNRKTVRSALAKLADHDLAFAVEFASCNRPTGWSRGTRSLAEVAEDLNAEAAAERRRESHQQEREDWQVARQTKYAGHGLVFGGRSKGKTP